jgi:hypothetical protein
MTSYYPGRPLKQRQAEAAQPEELDLGKPKLMRINGQPAELYTLGVLAKALNRKSGTIRKWETDGIIPTGYLAPSRDPRGQRRVYTRAQIEGLRQAAEEEGILEPNVNGKWKLIEETSFTEKAVKVFRAGG